jgi:phosphatidylglycerophosphatase A
VSERLIRICTTFFYVGDFPAAPGTCATFAGLLLALVLMPAPFLYMLVFAGVTFIGLVMSGPMEEITGRKDPGCIVIDEVAGIMLALFLLPPQAPVLWTAFFLFRAFDMFKIWPADRFESMGGGLGVMADDLVAGLYTNLVMHAGIYLSRAVMS